MQSTDLLTIGLVVGGAIILILAILQTRKIFDILKEEKFKKNWRNLYFLMTFFLLGYIGIIYIILQGYQNTLQILTGVIFFFGAVFVLIVVFTGLISFRKLHEVNEGLEEKISQMKLQNKELTQFNYATSHDLQEPLRNVTN